MASHSAGADLRSGLIEKLPELDENIMDELLQLLQRQGATSMEDLEYVTPEEIVPPLTAVQARKLLKSFSGDVTDRDKYKLKLREHEYKFLQLHKEIEAEKMTYKENLLKLRADINKAIADQNAEILNKAVSAADSENTTLIAGGAAYSAGLGAIIGAAGGPLGMAAGATVGAAVGGGLVGIVAAGNTDTIVEMKKKVYNQQIADGRKRLLEMDKDLERKNDECELTDVKRALMEFKKS